MPAQSVSQGSAPRGLLSSQRFDGGGNGSKRAEGRARAGAEGTVGSSGSARPPPVKRSKVEGGGSLQMDLDVLGEAALGNGGGSQQQGQPKGKGGRGPGRQKGRGKGDDKQQLIVKTLLKLLQDNRTMSGVLYDVVLIPESSGVVAAISEQGRFYQEQDTKSELGAPHLYIYAGMVQGLLQEDIGAQSKQALATHLEAYGDLSVEEKSEMVRVCKVEKVYAEGQRRILLCFERCGVRTQILNSLVQAGATRKQGRPPRGAMGRSLEEWLAELRM